MKNKIVMVEPFDGVRACQEGKCCNLATLKITLKDKPGKILLCDECHDKRIEK